MTTYAHIIDGFAVDVVVTPPELKDRYHPDWLARNPFNVVPDTDIHGELLRSGAIYNGDGTFINPVPVAVIPVAVVISASVFQDICETGLGSSARFGAIIRAMETSANDQIFSAYQRFSKSITFDKSKAAPLFSLLVGNGIMTSQERAAILNAWPMV